MISEPRYLTPINVFRTRQAAVPPHAFIDEHARVMNPEVETGVIPLDLGETLETDGPATTPMMMTAYLAIRAGESLTHEAAASGVIHYVMTGSGSSRVGDAEILWAAGDAFLLPGGVPATHHAGPDGARLFAADDSPALRFYGAQPLPGAIAATHFPAAEIEEQLSGIYQRDPDEDLTGKALFLSRPGGGAYGTITPSMVAAINTLEAGGDQRAHRHNAAAISLVLVGDQTYATAGDARFDWQPFLVTITPPAARHTIHNRGPRQARAFIVQDSGLFFHARATGFAFD